MKARAVICLEFPLEKQSEVILTSLSPETAKPMTTRSRAELERKGRAMSLTVEANDSVALRAALNAYLRWISSIVKVMKLLEKDNLLQ